MELRLVEDALRRPLEVPWRPTRIVSLVPSVTELLFDLGAGERVVAVSRYCELPRLGPSALEGRARVGGQKDPDRAAIVALRPDLVLAVKEENHKRDVAALAEAGLAVYVADVRDVEDALALVGEIGDLVDAAPDRLAELAAATRAGVDAARTLAAAHPRRRVFCPVWKDPFIAVADDTYAADVIATCGGEVVTAATRPTADRRYPKTDLDRVAAAAPDVVLLPDEPYAFSAADAAEIAARIPGARVVAVDGKTLTWYGRRTGEIATLARLLAG